MKFSLFILTAFLGLTFGQASQAHGKELKQLLTQALQDHPTLKAREAEVRGAQSGVDAARWQYWPTPTVSVQTPDRALIKGTDRQVALVGLKQPLWTGGRLEANSAQVQSKKDAAMAQVLEVRRDIALELVQAYGEAVTAYAKMQAYEETQITLQRLLEQIRRRAQKGVSLQSDIDLAEGRRESALADLQNAKLALDAALERLQTLVGRHIEVELQPGQILLRGEMGLALAEELIMAGDPTLMRMVAEEQELRALIDAQASSQWPDLSLNVVQRHGDVTGRSAQVMLQFDSKWGAGLSNQANLQAAIHRHQAKQEELVYRKQKLQELIRSELRLLESTQGRIQAYQRALRGARAVAASWDRQYVAGKKTWQEVMNSAREVTQSQVQLIETEGQASLAGWRLAILTRGVDEVLQND